MINILFGCQVFQKLIIPIRDVESVKFLWKWKHLEERSWKQTRKHLAFWGAGSIFHKTCSRDVEAVKFFWKRKTL